MTFLPWELTLIDRVPVLAALKASTMMRSNVAASCSEAGVDIYCTTRPPVQARCIDRFLARHHELMVSLREALSWSPQRGSLISRAAQP